MDNNVFIEINNLKELIVNLQQQLRTQQMEINSVKQIALKAQTDASQAQIDALKYWHFVGETQTER